MSGLSVVQALLALTFYKSARAELISLVFNGDFIKRLEQEVQMAYSRDTYPQKVMSLVMQLNRAVCLDHPEYNIRYVSLILLKLCKLVNNLISGGSSKASLKHKCRRNL